MINYSQFLKENLYGVFATAEGNKPKTRVFQFLFSQGNKVYFGTTNDKPVYSQIKKNPNVSFCCFSQGFSQVLSVNGTAVFVNDMAWKVRAMEEYPAIQELYQSPDNPIFEIFYVEVEEIQTFCFEDGGKIFKVT